MGGDDSQKLLPWRGTYSSPGRSKINSSSSPFLQSFQRHASSGQEWYKQAVNPCRFPRLLLIAVIGPLVSRGISQPLRKTEIPPPAPEEQRLGALIGKWKCPVHVGKQRPDGPESADGTWEGKWILNGHLVALTA